MKRPENFEMAATGKANFAAQNSTAVRSVQKENKFFCPTAAPACEPAKGRFFSGFVLIMKKE